MSFPLRFVRCGSRIRLITFLVQCILGVPGVYSALRGFLVCTVHSGGSWCTLGVPGVYSALWGFLVHSEVPGALRGFLACIVHSGSSWCNLEVPGALWVFLVHSGDSWFNVGRVPGVTFVEWIQNKMTKLLLWKVFFFCFRLYSFLS